MGNGGVSGEGQVRKGEWILTYSGIRFWPFDPRPGEIVIEDIAHSLGHQCRFNGHCSSFYSVAQHSVHVAELLETRDPAFAMHGLLHDASEAYLTDIPRPVKRHPRMAFYLETERMLQTIIFERFGLDAEAGADIVTWADNVLLSTEMRELVRMSAGGWVERPPPLDQMICPVAPDQAERQFLECYSRLKMAR